MRLQTAVPLLLPVILSLLPAVLFLLQAYEYEPADMIGSIVSCVLKGEEVKRSGLCDLPKVPDRLNPAAA